MNWNQLTGIGELEHIQAESAQHPVVVFKHSTRCSISSAALARFERSWDKAAGIKPYYLDLLAHRDVSNALASHYQIEHQSPQVLVIHNGKCVYDASHMSIDMEEAKSFLNI